MPTPHHAAANLTIQALQYTVGVVILGFLGLAVFSVLMEAIRKNKD